MSKISELELIESPSGDETVVVLKNGETMRVPLNGITDAALAPLVGAFLPLAAEIPAILSTDAEVLHLREDSSNSDHRIFTAAEWRNGSDYSVRAIVRFDGRRFFNIFCNTGCLIDAVFDLRDGVVVSSAAANDTSIIALGRGFFICSVRRIATASVSGNLQFRLGISPTVWAYAGQENSGLFLPLVSVRETGTGEDILHSGFATHASFTVNGLIIEPRRLNDPTAVADLERRTKRVEAEVLGQYPARVTEGNGEGFPSLYRPMVFQAGVTYRIEVRFAADQRHRLNIFSNTHWLANATFDAVAGSATGDGASIHYLGGNLYRAVVELQAVSAGNSNLQLRLFPDSGGHPYVADGESGLHVLGVDIYAEGAPLWRDTAVDLTSDQWLKQHIVVAVADDIELANLDARLRALETGVVRAPLGPLTGRKVAIIGTSIDIGGAWTVPFAEMTGCALQNLGVSGGAFGTASNGHYGSEASSIRLPEIDVGTELLIVGGPINDFGASEVPLGSVGDTTNATFAGAMYHIAAYCDQHHPGMRILFTIPFSGGPGSPTHRIGVVNGQGNTLPQFQNMVREVAEYVAWPVVDLRGFGIGFFTADDNTYDELHLDARGGLRVAKIYRETIERLARYGFLPA